MSSVRNSNQVIVVLEGTGGVGKSTQSRLITNWLREQGQSVCLLKLPCYSTRTGVMIQEMLRGRIRKWTPEATQLYYATNRAEIADYVANGLDAGWSFVFDRWVSSNALSTLGTLGLEVPQLLDLARNQTDRFDEILRPNFDWLRRIDQPFLGLFEGVSVVKIFLDVESGKLAESSRVGRATEVVNDVFEGGTEGDLRMEILRRYIRHDDGWQRVVRNSSTGVDEIFTTCVQQVREGANWTRDAQKEEVKRGEFIDFTDLVANMVYTREVIESWRSDLLVAEEIQTENECGDAWRLCGEGRADGVVSESDFLYNRARRK